MLLAFADIFGERQRQLAPQSEIFLRFVRNWINKSRAQGEVGCPEPPKCVLVISEIVHPERLGDLPFGQRDKVSFLYPEFVEHGGRRPAAIEHGFSGAIDSAELRHSVSRG
jgi:hypothetical protein